MKFYEEIKCESREILKAAVDLVECYEIDFDQALECVKIAVQIKLEEQKNKND